MNAVIYARYSSDKQTEQSIEGQLRECRSYAERNGYTVLDDYIDRALSGTSDNRPEFQRMIADSSKKQFQIIIVWKLDRFARNRYDSAIYKTKLKKNGVRVVSVTESIGEGHEAIIMEAMLEAMAEVYSKQLGENVARGMHESATKGFSTGGNTALGYFVGEDKRLYIDEKAAPAVRYIFEQYADGRTKKQIADGLNERGFKTKNGNPFDMKNSTSILHNRMYIGDYSYKGEIARDCPAIVSEELFNKCQARAEKTRRQRGQKVTPVEWLLRGKLYCGHCGTQMTGDMGTCRDGSRKYYYSCHKRKKYRDCDKKAEKKDFIEWYVCEQTVEYILHPSRIDFIADRVVKQYEKEFGQNNIKELEAQLARIDNELDGCVDSLIKAKSQTVIDRINDRAELLEVTKADTEIELAKLRIASEVSLTAPEVVTFLKSFCKGDLMDMDFRRRIIDTLVNVIYLYDDKVVIYFNVKDGKQVSHIEMIEQTEELFENANGSSCGGYCPPRISVFICGNGR